MLELGEFCSRSIRMVNTTGGTYYVTTVKNGINFGIGLSGRVRVEIYSYAGILEEVPVDGYMETGTYSLKIDRPTGLYFIRLSARMYDETVKAVFQEN